MGESGKRSRRLRRGWLCALALLAALAGGCGDDEPDPRASGADVPRLRAGARVFAEHCQTCHPLAGRPNTEIHTDYPPGLNLDEVAPTRAYARRMVETGGVAMGGFDSVLSDAEQRAVVDYVLEVGGRDVTVPPDTSAAELRRGRELYEEHCQRCHAIEGRPATRHNPIWIGTDFEDVRPEVLYVERIVREGQFEAMPSFRDRLSIAETRAVALYVNAMARGGPPRDGP